MCLTSCVSSIKPYISRLYGVILVRNGRTLLEKVDSNGDRKGRVDEEKERWKMFDIRVEYCAV
jgi:hypothetical protein